jgi:transposase-like protein
MSKIRQKYDEEFKKNAVKLSYATPKTMKDFAADLGIHVSLIYNWRKVYTEEGDKTKLAEQQDSLRQLQLENAELKTENEKNCGLLCETSEVRYLFVQKNTEYPVTKWAAMLNFSTSGYYDWLKTRERRDNKQKEYEAAITKIFTDSGRTYGPDRVCGVLRRQGYAASYRRVSNIMKRLGLSSIHNRRRQRSLTDSRKARGKEWPNLICDLEVSRPFQVITSDISYIRTSEGFE